MNEARRKQLNKAQSMIEEAKSLLEGARDEEQEFYDNMPENMQSGEKGEKAQKAVSALDDAINNCDEMVGSIDTAKQ